MIAHSVKFILLCHFPLYCTRRFIYVSGYPDISVSNFSLYILCLESYKMKVNPGPSFISFLNRRKGNRENIPAIKDCNGRLTTDPVNKANNLNNYYASVFSCKRDIPDINSTHSDKTFTIKICIIRKRLAMIGRKKSVGPDGIPGAILKTGGEAMIP